MQSDGEGLLNYSSLSFTLPLIWINPWSPGPERLSGVCRSDLRNLRKERGGCQEGVGLCPHLNHRKRTALLLLTHSGSSRDRKSAECRAGRCCIWGMGLGKR